MNINPYHWPVKSEYLDIVNKSMSLDQANYSKNRHAIEDLGRKAAQIEQKVWGDQFNQMDQGQRYESTKGLIENLQENHAETLKKLESTSGFQYAVITIAMEVTGYSVLKNGIPPDGTIESMLGSKGKQYWPKLIQSESIIPPGGVDKWWQEQGVRWAPHTGFGITGALVEKIRQTVQANLAQVPEQLKTYWDQLRNSRRQQSVQSNQTVQTPQGTQTTPSKMGSFSNWLTNRNKEV